LLLLLLLAAAAVAVGAIPRERPEQHGCRTRETWPGGRPRLGREQLGTMQKCGWGKLLVCLLLLLLLLAAAAAVAVAVVFVCPSHPCGFLVLRPLAGQPTIAFAVSSPLRPLRPSTFALGITRRFPGCRSRQAVVSRLAAASAPRGRPRGTRAVAPTTPCHPRANPCPSARRREHHGGSRTAPGQSCPDNRGRALSSSAGASHGAPCNTWGDLGEYGNGCCSSTTAPVQRAH
jgi:hypothetical protein